jgi:proline iminopeptidase
MAESPLAHILVEIDGGVVTFDPPGAFRSTRPAQVTMPEIVDCAEEALKACGVQGPLAVVGHSMGGLCALAFTLAYPGRVAKLVLIGSVSGGPAIARGKGLPWGMHRASLDFWRFAWWGFQVSTGRGSLAVHKRLLRLLWKLSYVDQRFIPALEIAPEDHRLLAPVRDRWPQVARRLDFSSSLKDIAVPTLVCVGRLDPQAPVSCSQELGRGIPGARLEIFEHSGHYPFIEEEPGFTRVLDEFLAGLAASFGIDKPPKQTIIIVRMVPQRAFSLLYAPLFISHLKAIDRKYHSLIRSEIETQLSFEPEIESRNRKPLKGRSFPKLFGSFVLDQEIASGYSIKQSASRPRFTSWQLARKKVISCLLVGRRLKDENRTCG